MRQIKFRGKRIDNGEWVYGCLIENCYIVGKVVDWEEDYFTIEFWAKADPDTVGQFTGLKDKNGKEIYEGDIVNIKGRKYIVEYWKGQLLVSWYLKSVRSGDTEYMELPVIGNGEVIGNIHNNLELLGGAE